MFCEIIPMFKKLSKLFMFFWVPIYLNLCINFAPELYNARWYTEKQPLVFTQKINWQAQGCKLDSPYQKTFGMLQEVGGTFAAYSLHCSLCLITSASIHIFVYISFSAMLQCLFALFFTFFSCYCYFLLPSDIRFFAPFLVVTHLYLGCLFPAKFLPEVAT